MGRTDRRRELGGGKSVLHLWADECRDCTRNAQSETQGPLSVKHVPCPEWSHQDDLKPPPPGTLPRSNSRIDRAHIQSLSEAPQTKYQQTQRMPKAEDATSEVKSIGQHGGSVPVRDAGQSKWQRGRIASGAMQSCNGRKLAPRRSAPTSAQREWRVDDKDLPTQGMDPRMADSDICGPDPRLPSTKRRLQCACASDARLKAGAAPGPPLR